MKKYKVGYTQGVYDMFHIGHLNLINHAKEYCDILIVGVNSDELVLSYKQKNTVICAEERKIIVENIKAVDKAVMADTLDKLKMLEVVHFDAIFIGDDWRGSERWKKTEEELGVHGVDVVYLPYTKDISSTILKPQVNNSVGEVHNDYKSNEKD